MKKLTLTIESPTRATLAAALGAIAVNIANAVGSANTVNQMMSYHAPRGTTFSPTGGHIETDAYSAKWLLSGTSSERPCPICGFDVDDDESMARHMWHMHLESDLAPSAYCMSCTATFTDSDAARLHGHEAHLPKRGLVIYRGEP